MLQNVRIFFSFIFFSGVVYASVENRDVVEGQNVRLPCRFNSDVSSKSAMFYWMYLMSDSKQDIIFRNNESYAGSHYTADFAPKDGRYDLTVTRAEYKRDNTQFECRMKNINDGNIKVLAVFSVTVLCEYSLFLAF